MPPQQQPTPVAITPHLTVDDARSAIAFYERAFDAKVLFENAAPDGRVLHAMLAVNGAQVMLNDSFPEMNGGVSRTPKALGGSPVTLHLDVPDVDAAFAKAVEAGAKVAMPVADMFWGDRYGVVVDPAGHRWSLATRKRAVDINEVRESTRKMFGKA